MHEAVVTFAEELASGKPAVLLVEDVHWAEDDLLDLIERVRPTHGARCCLGHGASRSSSITARAGGRERATPTTIWLDSLPAQETSRMLDELLDIELPSDLRRLLVDGAGGNPFFVEELVGELADAGVIQRWTSVGRARAAGRVRRAG